MPQPISRQLLNAVTATTTSLGMPVIFSGRGSVQFVAGSITSGNGVFTVDVSNDGVNWIAYNRLTTNVANTNAQFDTRVASVTLSSNTSAIVFIPDPVVYFRVKVTVTTDGVYSATALNV